MPKLPKPDAGWVPSLRPTNQPKPAFDAVIAEAKKAAAFTK